MFNRPHFASAKSSVALVFSFAAPALLILAAGCHSKKDATKDNFKDAINTYYSTRQDCIWSTPVRFPTREDTSNQSSTAGYDALTDQGLLARMQDTRKVFIFGSKQVSDYDLTDKGRAAWTADTTQPGFGNFCFGHREVTQVDDFTSGATSTVVDYHYRIAGAPSWADNTEVKTAFPEVQAALAGPLSDKANLTLTDNGWVVTSPTAP